MATQRHCERCVKTYMVPPSKLATSRYCSNKCRYPRVTKVCATCLCKYSVVLSQAKRSRFCSKTCSRAGHSLAMQGKGNSNYRGAVVAHSCEWCGTAFDEYASKKPRYCSTECKVQWQASWMHGENSPGWKGGVSPERQTLYSTDAWKSASNEVWKREKNRCQKCKKRTAHRGKAEMHIHHIVPFSSGKQRTDTSNLALLCAGCHRWVHSLKNVESEWRGEYGRGTV